jgi:glucose-6-phosphate dehydrogenase assembly protein OpcA
MNPLGHQPVPTPGDVERQLAEFWRKASTDEQAVMRACSMNLVVVCGEDERDLTRTTELIAKIARTAPGRALVVSRSGTSDFEGLEVYVSAHCHRGPGGAQVCSEQVTIETGDSGEDLVPGTVLQLLVEDMPVYTWWRRRELNGSPWLDPLVGLSDYWVVDSAVSAEPDLHLRALEALSTRLSWNGHVVDAAWMRLEPWREAVASFFDNPALRPALERMTRVRVEAGGRVACAYLAGWLASRLGFRSGGRHGEWARDDGAPVAFDLVDRGDREAGQIAAVQIEAAQAGDTILFSAKLTEERDDCLVLCVGTEGHRLPSHKIKLPSLDRAALICGVLQRTGPDPIFQAALSAATHIA